MWSSRSPIPIFTTTTSCSVRSRAASPARTTTVGPSARAEKKGSWRNGAATIPQTFFLLKRLGKKASRRWSLFRMSEMEVHCQQPAARRDVIGGNKRNKKNRGKGEKGRRRQSWCGILPMPRRSGGHGRRRRVEMTMRAARKGAVALIFLSLCWCTVRFCCLPRTAASTDGQMASIREQTHLLLVPAAIGNAGAPPRRALHLDGRAWG